MPKKKKINKNTDNVTDKFNSFSKSSNEELSNYNSDYEEQQKILKFIDNVIKKNIKIEKDKNSERLSDFNRLVTINSEWLDSFFIIGYNLNGEEVVISKASNAKDYNSIMMLLKKVFINLFVKNEP